MKQVIVVAALVAGLSSPLFAGGATGVTGDYVEARTAEVFTGGCIMGSEAATMGKQAVLAWRVNRGTVDGVSLDGLSIVAAVAGDHNLGIEEMGGASPNPRTVLLVDERATPAQQSTLVTMIRGLAKDMVGQVVQVTTAPIEFTTDGMQIRVMARDVQLDVMKHLDHDPSCGAMQWFHPLATVEGASIGIAEQHAFSGSGLGTKWSHPNQRSAFFGTFSY